MKLVAQSKDFRPYQKLVSINVTCFASKLTSSSNAIMCDSPALPLAMSHPGPGWQPSMQL